MTTKTKLITALSLILVTAFVTTSVINYEFTREAVRDELLNTSLPLTSKNIYSEIHSALMRPFLVSSSMANDSFLKDWVMDGELDLGAIKTFLRDIRNEYGFMTAFFVSAKTDIYYYQDGILKEIGPRDPHDVWYYAFTRSKQKFDLDVDTNEAEDGKLTIFINFRVEAEDGTLLGVTGVGVSIEQAVELINKSREENKREIYLVDQDGLMQVHSDKALIERYYITKGAGIRDVADRILVKKDDPISLEYDWENTHYLLSARYIPELKWHLIVEQNENTALTSAKSNLKRTIIIGMIASILIIVLCSLAVNHYQSRLERMASIDPLTGAGNRHALDERFTQAAYKAGRYDDRFSVIILDLDHFKAINDTYGHVVGDRVLKEVADILKATLRPSDFLARWGGDEFLVLMDGDEKAAHTLARRSQDALAASNLEPEVTFCFGVARYADGDDLDTVTLRADEELYRAKRRRA